MVETYESALLRRLAALLEKQSRLKAFPIEDGGSLNITELSWVFGSSCHGYEEMVSGVSDIIDKDFDRLRKMVLQGVENEVASVRAELKAIDA